MCGIIGYTGKRDAISVVLGGLKRLEYRGYDSAGIAYLEGGRISIKRCKGKIKDLDGLLGNHRPLCRTAIGHTRWATHGRPSRRNAHPHRAGGIVLVHNGIIENYLPLKRDLEKKGVKFTSETDTEAICHLINKFSEDRPLEDAVKEAMRHIRGAYALAIMNEREPGKIVAVRKDSPLIAGVSKGEYFVASDIPAFLNHSRNAAFLNDDEMAVLTADGIRFSTVQGRRLKKPVVSVSWNASMAEKGGYKHYMLKEIFEQPRSIADTLTGRFNAETGEVNLDEFQLGRALLKKTKKVSIAACGTSWHAALAGKYMIEELARVPVEVDIASEFRYRNPLLERGDLFIAITQSGETADTLAAQRIAKKLGARVLSVCNVIGSTSAREADSVFYTRSGPEIGVASTKAFTAQMTGLCLFAIALGKIRGALPAAKARELLLELLKLPDKVETVLLGESIAGIAKDLSRRDSFLYLGRGMCYPLALEGALKLKEISYIHAEAYPAGEMKHGPIALIDKGHPVLFLAPRDGLYEKIIGNMQEIRSRGGTIVSVITEGDADVKGLSDYSVEVPDASRLITPLLMAVPLQLLAYHIGVLRGCDVDQPRNLAKSVTVE